MSDIDATTLLPSERLRRQALDGDVTRIHRGQRYADEGATFTVDGVTFAVTDVEERTLGDLTDADARAEGARDLEHYREILDRAHEEFEWDDGSAVVCHRFEKRE